MANYPCARNRGVPLRHFFMLVLLLTLVGLLGGCGASTTPGSSHPSGPTPTTTQGLKGMISEFRLTASNAQIGDIAVGPDRNLWFTEVIPNAQSGKIAGKIGRITPAGQIREFPPPSSENGGAITTGPDNALWFTEFGSNIIGRLS
jgi:hypothetical protein